MTTLPDCEAEQDQQVWSVCGQLKHLSTGGRAALRRMRLTRSAEADGMVETVLRRAGILLDPSDDASFDMWRTLVHAAAIVAGTSSRMAHAGKRPFGKTLSAIDMSSGRVNRLLTARGLALFDQIDRTAYLLASGGEAIPTNMTELRDLASPDPGRADRARRSIAREYFAAEDKKNKKDGEKAK